MAPAENAPPDDAPLDARRLLRAIIDTSEDAIITKNMHGIVLSWNTSAERLFGYTAAEAIGRHITFIIPEDRRFEEDDIMSRLRAGRFVRRFETVRRHRDGGLRDVELSITPIRSDDGELIGACKIARDLTERRAATAALLEEEGRFRTLADNISQLAWMAEPDGWIFWYNRRWFDYTGTTLDDMQGWGWRAVHHPDHVDRVVRRVQHSWDTGEPWEDTFPLRGRDGQFRWFLSRALPIRDADGRITRWFGTNTDITDLRRLEGELAEANRRKDEFLATLSHELRNPLGAIRTSVAVMQASGGDPAAAERALAAIERQSAHVSRLLGDLLDVTRITRERLVLKVEDTDLGRIAADAVEMVAPIFSRAGVALEVDVPGAGLAARLDPVRVQQLIANLLSNAAKYTPAGGSARLSVRRDGATFVIAVTDTGIGISAEMVDRIFDLFVQVVAEGRARGLGIGLSIVRHVAELHGGSVRAHSDGPGTGATFEVRLPLVAAGRADMPLPHESDQEPAAPRRVLLVDDDKDNLDALATLLRLEGHVVTVARSGEEALAVAADAAPDIVLLDIGLPGIDGYETCRRLRTAGVATRIVAVTGWGQPRDRQQTTDAGFDDHLVKPVNPKDVLALVASDT